MIEVMGALSKPGMTEEEILQWRSTFQTHEAFRRMPEFVKCKRVKAELLVPIPKTSSGARVSSCSS